MWKFFAYAICTWTFLVELKSHVACRDWYIYKNIYIFVVVVFIASWSYYPATWKESFLEEEKTELSRNANGETKVKIAKRDGEVIRSVRAGWERWVRAKAGQRPCGVPGEQSITHLRAERALRPGSWVPTRHLNSHQRAASWGEKE